MKKDERDQEHGVSRRNFLKYAVGTGLAGAVVSMEPVSYLRGTAYAEKKLPPEYWEAASKYGPPQGKFGKVGDPVKLTVGYQPYCLQCMTANIDKAAQLWRKHLPKGSKLVWFRSLSGPLINNNMIAGKNMFGYMCDTPGLRAMDTVECRTGSSGGYDTGEHGAMVVRKDLWDSGKVKTVKDLDGSKIGVPLGSFSHRQALDIIAQFKIKPRLLDQSTELQVTHLRAKNIDACVTWEPYPTYLEFLGIGHRLITGLEMDDTCPRYRPQNVYHNWITSCTTLMIEPWLRDRPDIMVAYLNAEEEARDMWANDVELASYWCWKDIPEIPQPVVRMVMEMNVPDSRFTHTKKAGANLTDHLKGIALQWRALGMLTTPKSKDPEKFIEEAVDENFQRIGYTEYKKRDLWTSEKLPGFPAKMRESQTRRHDLKNYMDVALKPKDWKPTKVKW